MGNCCRKRSFDKFGYDQFGYDRQGFDRNGLNKHGIDRFGIDRALLERKIRKWLDNPSNWEEMSRRNKQKHLDMQVMTPSNSQRFVA